MAVLKIIIYHSSLLFVKCMKKEFDDLRWHLHKEMNWSVFSCEGIVLISAVKRYINWLVITNVLPFS